MRRWLNVIVVLLLISVVVLWQLSKGRRNQTFQGIYLVTFERSDFYPNADHCPPSGPRFWLDPESNPEMSNQLGAFFQNHRFVGPHAVYLRFVGDISSVGQHGHLGQYWREVRVTTVLEVATAKGCW